jgi:acylphosphatase
MTVHLIIKGKVQGVFYRASAKKFADENGIKGWIKNTSEGHVETLASGNENIISVFIDWCKKGPQHANVEEVMVKEMEEFFFDEFKITR